MRLPKMLELLAINQSSIVKLVEQPMTSIYFIVANNSASNRIEMLHLNIFVAVTLL